MISRWKRRNWITYGGKDLREYGLYCDGKGTLDAPERVLEEIVIPGRNGTLTIDSGRYENAELSYDCFIIRNFRENIEGIRNFLLQGAAYRRLEDTYHPDEYRMARYTQGLQVEPTELMRQGSFTLTFNCMPQRFLKDGEIPKTYTGAGTIYNRTLQEAKPLLRVWGNGVLGIGDYSITLTGTTDWTDLDCETEDATYGAVNRNANVSGEYPRLKPGENGISLGTGITKLQIIPRWWII